MEENENTITYRFVVEVTVSTTNRNDLEYVGRQVEKMIENNSEWSALVQAHNVPTK